MSGDCFWTALVNCFDDCEAAPPPPGPEDNIVFGEDFDTLPNARAPSGGPAGFSSTSSATVGVSGGFMVSTVASADDWIPNIAFSGSGMAPAIGMSVGFTLNDAAMTPGKSVDFRIEATESGGVSPVGLKFTIVFDKSGIPGKYDGLKFGGIGDDFYYLPPEEGGYMEWGGTFASFAADPGNFAIAGSYDMRLMWNGSALVFSINGVEIDAEPFTSGPLPRMPQFNDINVQVRSFSGVQQALALDYVRLIGEP